MGELAAEVIVGSIATYLVIGVLFGLPFVIWGVGRVDPAAKAATPGFRLLVLPGSVALWPLLANRLVRRRTAPPMERNAHRRAAARQSPKRRGA